MASSSSSSPSVNSYDPTPMVQTPQLLQLFPTTRSQMRVFDWDLNEDPPVDDVNDEILAPGEEAPLQVFVAAVGGSKKRKRDEVEICSNSFNPKKKMKLEAAPGVEENKKKEE